MSESKLKKSRTCKICGHTIYGDAAKMKDHEADHRLAERAGKSGLVLPERGIVIR